MDVTTASSVGTTPVARSPAENTAAISSDFETFLRMLTVQIENQDPLNPIQSSEFAVQLATFSGVEQQVRTNDLLSDLVASMSVGGLGEVAGWIGNEGRADVAAEFAGSPVTIYPNVPQAADQATLIARDADGRTVQRIAISTSDESVSWNGTDNTGVPVPPGFYSFETEAMAGGEFLSATPAEVYGSISEVRIENGQNIVVFADGSARQANSISGIRLPSEDVL